jgi:hypothetical protein
MKKFLLLLFPLYSYAAGPSLGGSLSSPPISSNAIVSALGFVPGAFVSTVNTLYVNTNSSVTAQKGNPNAPYSTLTNAIANLSSGDTLYLAPGQVFDCGINALTLSNVNVIAYGATLTVSNGPNVLFTVKGPLNWFGGTVRDLGVATDASAILFPFKVAGTTAFTNNFYNLIIRSRTDALNLDPGSAAFAPTINIFGCDWEDMWDVFTCSSPQTHRCKINAVGSRFAAIASLHTGSFGADASIASAGTGYDFVFTGCDLICSNSTATCYGLLCDVNTTFTLAGTSCAFDTTASDSEQLFSGDNYAITVDGHPFPNSYVFSGSGLVKWKGWHDTSNAVASASITFPNTTVNWTNPVNMPIILYIDNSGVTGSLVKKNGQQVFSSLVGDVTLHLKPGDYFSETYTVGTPSARWEPQ